MANERHPSRNRTGSVEPFKRADGTLYYRARVRLGDKSRVRVDIPAKHSATDEERETYARARQEHEDATGRLLKEKRARIERAKAPTDDDLSLDAYWKKLCERREAEGYANVGKEKHDWKKWIGPRIGRLDVRDVTRAQVEDVRDALDAKVKERIARGLDAGISGKTAMNIWSLLRTTFREAVSSRERSMRVRTDDPCANVKPPLESHRRKKTFVYPSEFATLVACAKVPLSWRRLYAIACYLYLRPGELRALRWGDVDVEAGIVHVTKAYNETARVVSSPKTENGVRDVPIDSSLLPLLKAMSAGKADSDPVAPLLADVDEKERAKVFRDHLRDAGVGRARLFQESETTLEINFRSLRDTGITWLALAGVDLAKIQRRAGHDNVTTTLGYIKMAEDLSGKIGAPFPPLLPLLSGQVAGQVRRPTRKEARTPKDLQCRRRESNRTKPAESSHDLDVSAASEIEKVEDAPRTGQEKRDLAQSKGPSLTELRGSLDAAILDRRWDAVAAIHARIATVEREGVVDLEAERARRGRTR